jgi:hypothetical protein
MDEVEKIFLPISKSLGRRVSGMGGYTSKCEKKSKSLHQCTVRGEILIPGQQGSYTVISLPDLSKTMRLTDFYKILGGELARQV